MASLSNETRAELRLALDSFLNASTTTEQDARALLHSLKFRPTTAPVVDTLPIDEVEERLVLAGNIDIDSEWEAIHVSILMAIPIDVLREVASSPSN